MQKSKRIKWSLVDLRRPASELAAELGTTSQAIYAARRRLGIITPNLSGGKPGNKGGGAREGAGRKPIGDAPLVQYQLRIHRELIERAKTEAEKRGLTAAELIRLALITYLNKADNGQT